MTPTNATVIQEAYEDLVNDRTKYMEICVPMYNATIEGDYGAAKAILKKRGNLLLGCRITKNQETPLQIAAMARSTKLVKFFLSKMKMVDLELLNKDENTAFCLAVIADNTKIVDTMFKTCPRQLIFRGSNKMMPLYLAALYGNHTMVVHLAALYRSPTMVRHLSSEPNDRMTTDDWNKIFLKCVEVDLLDVALQILDQQQTDFSQDEYVIKVLHSLAPKPYAFDQPNGIWKTISTIFEVFHLKVGPCLKKNEATQLLRNIWEKFVINHEKDIGVLLKGPCIIDNNGRETHPSQIPFVAAKLGNVKFLVELIRAYPDLIWMRDDNEQTIFHVAVSHRRESIYSLLYEIGSMKDLLTPLTDQQGNNILHLAGMSALNNPYENSLTAPFQMQNELLWFKEVKAMIPPFCREAENTEGRMPYELFTENHKDLVSESKKWMKETTNQCMVAAVLIATIGFAVVTSIPGGYDQDNGFPHFLHDGHLIVFIIFDAISFILSSVSILMFLSIVVSRYTETDFSESLPQKLTIGLATLFLSILTMMVAFGVSFFVVYHHKFMLIPLLIFALGAIPVLLYTKLQFPLFADVFHSTFGSRHLFKPKRHMLYYQNPRF